MSNFKPFNFSYPVTAMNNVGKIFVISTVTVYANAHLYADGTVRTVDIIDVMDADGNNIGHWLGLIESNEGTLNEVLEKAATAHAVGLYEENEPKKDTGEQPEPDYDPFDIFGSMGRILRPQTTQVLRDLPY